MAGLASATLPDLPRKTRKSPRLECKVRGRARHASSCSTPGGGCGSVGSCLLRNLLPRRQIPAQSTAGPLSRPAVRWTAAWPASRSAGAPSRPWAGSRQERLRDAAGSSPGLVLFPISTRRFLITSRGRPSCAVRRHERHQSLPAAPPRCLSIGRAYPDASLRSVARAHAGPEPEDSSILASASSPAPTRDDIANPGAVEFVACILAPGSRSSTAPDATSRCAKALRCFAREGLSPYRGPARAPAHEAELRAARRCVEGSGTPAHQGAWRAHSRLRQRADPHQQLPEHFPSALCVHLLTDDSARGIHVLPASSRSATSSSPQKQPLRLARTSPESAGELNQRASLALFHPANESNGSAKGSAARSASGYRLYSMSRRTTRFFFSDDRRLFGRQ